MLKVLRVFLALMLFWIGLTGLDRQELAAGIFFSLAIAILTRDYIFQEGLLRKLHPLRIAHFLAYIPIYIWAEITGHLRVSRIILFSRHLAPGIVKYHPKVRKEVALTAIGNLTTFTPGTFTLALNKQEMLIHCLDVRRTDVESDTRKMEKYVKGVAE